MYSFKLRGSVLLALFLILWTGYPASATPAIPVDCSAASAILYEPSSGRVLYEKNAHVTRPMASTTKLMTALLAAESYAPQDTLVATAEALAVEGSSMGLLAGDRIACEDLLYGLLLSSGNDAANVFALSMAGSYEAFADKMNARAAEIGMTATRFVTPSGLDAEGHGASAYDMALLAATVLKNERLAAICATEHKTITVNGRDMVLSNHNRLLSTVEGCVGMKTGYTSQSGRCLVSAATRNGVTLIAVTLDCSDDWQTHRVLLEEGFALMRSLTLSLPRTVSLTVFGGTRSEVDAVTEATTVVCLQSDEAVTTKVTALPYVWAPVEVGDPLGTVTYFIGDTAVATMPLTASQAVPQAEEKTWLETMWRLFQRLFAEAVSR